MVCTHLPRQLVAIVACFSVLALQSDTVSFESLNGLPADGGISWDVAGRGLQSSDAPLHSSLLRNDKNLSPRNRLQTIERPPLPSLYIPERYSLVPPEENFLRELILHSAASAETRGTGGGGGGGLWKKLVASSDYILPETNADQVDLKLPTVDSTADKDWLYQENSPLYLKPKRMYQHFPQQLQRGLFQSYEMRGGDDSLTKPRMPASKKWWGGRPRPRGQMDRRASQSKHYDCLKSCIKEGKLHPIQCHTLC
ncbi:uncharacterized protein LOC135212506 isoform X2 [Macrobrachium nipponense]|uniref:uncharacterized protein LOC135212506 isoform X2 n=1 Tax=Macrobrachium nipponense TaxID=159736 RepID=UPI0030C89C77